MSISREISPSRLRLNKFIDAAGFFSPRAKTAEPKGAQRDRTDTGRC